MLKPIYENEVSCSVFTQNKERKINTHFHLKIYLTQLFMVYSIITSICTKMCKGMPRGLTYGK